MLTAMDDLIEEHDQLQEEVKPTTENTTSQLKVCGVGLHFVIILRALELKGELVFSQASRLWRNSNVT
jgi:hypothetical protein